VTATRRFELSSFAGPAFLALLGLGFALVPLARGEIFLYWDNAQQHYAQTVFLHQALRAGELPHWWPHISAGFPVIAEGQAAHFYPVRLLLAFLLPPVWAFTMEIGLYLAISGVATYLFLREFRLRPSACVVAGLCQMFGSYSIVFVRNMALHRSFCLLPLAMLAAERLATRPTLAAGLMGSLVLALQLLAGHPTFAIVTLVGSSVYLICRLIQQSWHDDQSMRTSGRHLAISFARWVAVVALAVGLSAIQFLPQLKHVEQSIRQGGLDFEYATVTSLPAKLQYLPQLVFPYAYAQGDYVRAHSGGGFALNVAPSSGLYLGAMAVVLAALGIWWHRRWPDPTWSLLASLLIGLGLALGARTPLFPALRALPGMNGLRFPSRFLLWASFCLACLAGVGLHRLLARSRLGRLRPREALPFLLLAGGAFALGGLLWVGGDAIAIGGRMAPDLRSGILTSLLLFMGAAALAGSAVVARRPYRPVLAGLIVLFALADLWYFRSRSGYAPTVPARAGLASPELVDTLKKDPEQFRVLSLAASEEELTNRLDDLREFVQADLSAIWGIESSDIWMSLMLKRYYAVRESIVSELLDSPASGDRLAGFLGALNVKYIVAPNGVPLTGWERVHQTERATLWRNPRILPRAFLVGTTQPERIELRPEWERRAVDRLRGYRAAVVSWYTRAAEVQIVDNILEHPIDYRTTAVVAGPAAPQLSDPNPEGEVRLAAQRSNRVEYQVQSTRPALLVFSSNFYPGWTATVNGRPANVYPTNYVTIGVPVPAGQSEVVLSFVTPGYRLGAVVTATSLLLASGAAIATRRRRRPFDSRSRS